MEEISKITEDKRPIKALWFSNGDVLYSSKALTILAYDELGEMAYVAWFVLLDQDENIISRINGKYIIQIDYFSSD